MVTSHPTQRRWLGWAILCILSSDLIAQAQAGMGRIPSAHATTLSGEPVTLPTALSGKPGVLVIGFSHAAQAQVQAWGQRLSRDYTDVSGFQYFEIPLLAAAPKMLRGMIIRKMGAGIKGKERDHFLPITEDESAWRSAAGYSASDSAYVLVVDSSGTILWRTRGAANESSYAEVKQHLDLLLKH